jgi:hypothetical protein
MTAEQMTAKQREQKRERKRKRYAANPEYYRKRESEYKRKRYAANPGCRERYAKRAAVYREKNREKIRVYYRHWRAKNPYADRKRRYGSNAAEHYDEQLKKHRGCCAICSRKMKTLHQDHDHRCCQPVRTKSGLIRPKSCGECLRGLLCNRCNFFLGYLESDPTLYRRALRYLEKWKRAVTKRPSELR